MREEAIRRQQAERKRERDRGRKANERGRHFHKGMAQQRGETRENGWQHESKISTPFGDRVHDTAREKEGREQQGREFTEYKNKVHLRADELLQLAKDRHVLENDPNARGTWVIRGDAAIDPAVRRTMERMEQLFPGRFTVEKTTKAERDRAVTIGKELERQERTQQLELFDSDKLRKQEKARERAERVKETIRTQEAAARAIAEKEARERARAREAHEQAIRAKMPRVPDEVIQVLIKSGPMPGEVAHEGPDVSTRGATTRGGREARGIERGIDRGRN